MADTNYTITKNTRINRKSVLALRNSDTVIFEHGSDKLPNGSILLDLAKKMQKEVLFASKLNLS